MADGVHAVFGKPGANNVESCFIRGLCGALLWFEGLDRCSFSGSRLKVLASELLITVVFIFIVCSKGRGACVLAADREEERPVMYGRLMICSLRG